MNLPKFEPKPWVVDIIREIPPPEGRKPAKPWNIESTAFYTLTEAQAYAKTKSNMFGDITYKAQVREATPKDFAEQRITEIGEYVAKHLENILKEEENILAYDIESFGTVDYSKPIKSAIEDVLDNYPPEGEDPMRDGWVGANGHP